tara:strand:- start:5747 stop:6268 length:522 start_codon:yes stop_codon:yes gene_type:complete
MKWKVSSEKFKDVLLFNPSVSYDFRGEIFTTYKAGVYEKLLGQVHLEDPFVEDKISISRKNVLRGLHGDHVTDKLVQCLHGEIYLVLVDWREDSPTYMKWESFLLNDKNKLQVLIPKGFLNGHLCLSEKCIFSYKQTSYYKGADKQITAAWDDRNLGIFWPIKNPILSERDAL